MEDFFIPGLSESKPGDSTLGIVQETLILSYKEALSPIPLPTFLGNSVLKPETSSAVLGCFENLGLDFGKEYTWSRGLGYEHSLIKTRSARRKEGPLAAFSVDFIPPHSDIGVLRGMKSLARAKP